MTVGRQRCERVPNISNSLATERIDDFGLHSVHSAHSPSSSAFASMFSLSHCSLACARSWRRVSELLFIRTMLSAAPRRSRYRSPTMVLSSSLLASACRRPRIAMLLTSLTPKRAKSESTPALVSSGVLTVADGVLAEVMLPELAGPSFPMDPMSTSSGLSAPLSSMGGTGIEP